MIFLTATLTTTCEINAPKDRLISFTAAQTNSELYMPSHTMFSPGLIDFRIDQLKAHLRGFAHLKPDWNSFGASPISPDAISLADDLLSACEMHRIIPSRVDPTGDDSVIIENHRTDRRLIIEVFGSGEIAVLIKNQSGKKAFMASTSEVIALIASFA